MATASFWLCAMASSTAITLVLMPVRNIWWRVWCIPLLQSQPHARNHGHALAGVTAEMKSRQEHAQIQMPAEPALTSLLSRGRAMKMRRKKKRIKGSAEACQEILLIWGRQKA